MQRWMIVIILILLVSTSAQSAVYPIILEKDKANPGEVTINKGDSVQFKNNGAVRRISLSDNRRSGMLSTSTSTKFEFNDSATFEVEGEQITGTITVVESGAPPPVDPEAALTGFKGETVYVGIVDHEFVPADLLVSAGDTVVWENAGTVVHSVDFLDNEGKQMNTGQSYNRTFASEGTFQYQCRYHNAMKGKVTVAAAQTAQTSDDQQTTDIVHTETTLPPPVVISSTPPGHVGTPPPVPPPPVAVAPPSDIENKILVLRAELKEEIQRASATADSPQLRTDVGNLKQGIGTLQTKIEGAISQIETLTEQTEEVERIARNPPKIEIPKPQTPIMLYVSLFLDFILIFAVVALALTVLKKGSKKGQTAVPAQVAKDDVSSLVKPTGEPAKKEESPPADPTAAYIAKCRQKGLNDDQIVAQFVKSGWKEENARKRVAGSN